MHPSWRQKFRSDEGQVLVLFGLMAFVLVGCVALAVDVGYLLTERRSSQNIADAAALAGASALLAGEDHATSENVARRYATLNGASASTTVVPDAEGDRWSGTVTVDITQPVQEFFLGALYTGPWQVSAHAVADLKEVDDARYALVGLREGEDEAAISINGGIRVEVENGGIISNSHIETDGDSSVVTSDGFIDAAEVVESASGWQADLGIRNGRAPIDDPFDGFAPPAVPTTPDPPYTGNLTCNPPAQMDCEFYPGYYRNANIKIFTPPGGAVTFHAGLYYFENSTLQLMNTNARIKGEGVNFYFTGNDNRDFFQPGNGEFELTAPGWSDNNADLEIHGDYRDVAVWIDNCGGEFDASGNQDYFVGGVIYAPCSNVYLHGTPDGETISGMVVADRIEVSGNVQFGIEYIPYGPTSSFEVYLRE